MKCNIEKINAFFNNEKFDKDIKDFVLELLKNFCKAPTARDNIYAAQFAFIGLGFYDIEDSDDTEDYSVIDFYKLNTLNPEFRKLVFKLILKFIKTDGLKPDSDFFEQFVYKDLKILVEYEKWSQVNRKNKLTSLSLPL
jgi:hypothetical protein